MKCRSCQSTALEQVLDLGATPLANSLLTTAQLGGAEERFPLVLAFCPGCALVQITETVEPEKLFRDYLYFSSFSDTMLAHAKRIAERLTPERKLGPGSLVVEVASNDGYLLQYYKARGVPVLGIEPARNVAKVAIEQRGVDTISEFFGLELATQLAAQGKAADVIHANNVLAHVADTNGVVAGFQKLLKPGGCVVVEAPYVGDMVDHTEFDTIYHEHLCYFSLGALEALFARHGLKIFDVERLAIHGGTLRIFAAHASSDVKDTERVIALRAEERSRHLLEASFYRAFARDVSALKEALMRLLTRLKAEGKTVAAYGASAKGSTLINYAGIGRELVDFVVDRSTYKQGRHMPGMHLPISAPERLLEAKPDYVLLLTWNFAEEIFRQQRAYLQGGGRFIVPVPRPRVVGLAEAGL